jgi:hypothetical protein
MMRVRAPPLSPALTGEGRVHVSQNVIGGPSTKPAEVTRMARRIALALGLAVAVPLAATGCSASSNPVEDAGEGACVEAGGVCVTGGLCPNAGPQVCGAGAVCCVLGKLTIQDASAD